MKKYVKENTFLIIVSAIIFILFVIALTLLNKKKREYYYLEDDNICQDKVHNLPIRANCICDSECGINTEIKNAICAEEKCNTDINLYCINESKKHDI